MILEKNHFLHKEDEAWRKAKSNAHLNNRQTTDTTNTHTHTSRMRHTKYPTIFLPLPLFGVREG
jgi:hypothetical protein